MRASDRRPGPLFFQARVRYDHHFLVAAAAAVEARVAHPGALRIVLGDVVMPMWVELDPVVAMSVAVAEQLRGDRVPVGLKVTDRRDGTDTATQDINVTAPPPLATANRPRVWQALLPPWPKRSTPPSPLGSARPWPAGP